MSGDPSNASAWADADVYIAPLGTPEPATVNDAFPAGWQLVGLLDGDDGFAQSRNWDTSDRFAWGGVLVRTTRRNFKQTVKWAGLEDNDVTRDLIWPGSSGGDLVVPFPERMLIAFETVDGDKIRRLICAYEADTVVSDDIVDNEADVTKYVYETTIYPDADGVLFHEQTGSVSSS